MFQEFYKGFFRSLLVLCPGKDDYTAFGLVVLDAGLNAPVGSHGDNIVIDDPTYLRGL